ncbi:Zn(II)2Cys6 transcription factor [Aspergillus flavus]|uniref:Zn(II)2Cys6 transcription factor n=1 Tax=Aspergillus flavus TaxID=5059 RepID=A0AB74CK95_ASPFL|nr:Zn(II)2Cys6 transcription factor [Aspergillus flavus]
MVVYRAPESRSPFLTSDEERQSFDFFLHQTRYRFPIDFTDPVLRAAHSDEGLARAIISFGALQQIYECGDDPSLLSPQGQFAMRQYGRALEKVRVWLGNGANDLSLVCCLLFACFECIRGCRRAAVVHIKSGLDILLQCGEELAWDVVSRDMMISMFIRLDNQLVGLLGTSLSRTLKRDGERGSSILERVALGPNGEYVVHSLHGVLNSIFHDRLDMALIMEGHSPSVRPVDRRRTSRYLKEWHGRFVETMSSPGLSRQYGTSYVGGQDPDIMRIWYIIGKMYVAVPPDGSEDAWDQFRPGFETIVSLVESYLLRTRQLSQKRAFSFDLGIVSPLYIVGVRCRDMSIRRRAIWLLESCERREILWDSTLAAMAARRVMEFEGSRDIWPKSLGRRVRNVTAVLDDDNGVSIEFE